MKILFFVLLLHFNGFSQELPVDTQAKSSTEEKKIDFKDVLFEIPATSMAGLKTSFSKKSIPWWVGIVGSTLILYHNDEVILENWQREGRAAGLGNTDKTKAVLSAGEIDLLRLPTDTASWMYFLGDGWMNFGISAGFVINGQINDNVRAYNTGLRIAHGMMTSTIFSQILKRATGRESPYVKTERFGKWSPFPSIPEYQKRTAFYDAMPSGHVMTATLTFTIINEAYPEYSNYTIPIGVVWVSALSFQMVNNGVHWASDYPLGIAMGYVFGVASAQMGKPKATDDKSTTSWMILPVSTPESQGITWRYSY